MKRLAFILFTGLMFCAGFSPALRAQAPHTLVYGTSAFADSLWSIDTTAGWLRTPMPNLTMAGFTVEGVTSIAWEPCTFETYAIVKVTGLNRQLATLDLSTGVLTHIGSLGDNFSSLAFDDDCILYGVTGDGAATPESFYAIDKNNATTSLLAALGNGDDGEVICFNPWNRRFFHWSGNGTVMFEKFLPSAPYTQTPITSNGLIGEIFGSLCLGPNEFLCSTINADFVYLDTLGNLRGPVGGATETVRGLVMPPAFAAADDTLCTGEALTVDATGTALYTTHFHWGDGNSSTTFNSGASHNYAAAGQYTVVAELEYGSYVDTFWTTTVTVIGIQPVVNPDTTELCAGDSVLLSTSTPGTGYQWFADGNAIAGATGNNYVANAPGIYNVLLTDSVSGCADSAATGAVVMITPLPVADFSFAPNPATAGQPVSFTNTSTNHQSSLWNFGDGSALSTDANPVHTFAEGSFTVTLIVENACGADTLSQSMSVLAGLEDGMDAPLLSLWPNPTQGEVWLSAGPGFTGPLELKLIDLRGRESGFEVSRFMGGSEMVNWDLSALPQGLYWLMIEGREGKSALPLVILE